MAAAGLNLHRPRVLRGLTWPRLRELVGRNVGTWLAGVQLRPAGDDWHTVTTYRAMPPQLCYAERDGMLCDRSRDHYGDHVDIFGPLPGHSWPA